MVTETEGIAPRCLKYVKNSRLLQYNSFNCLKLDLLDVMRYAGCMKKYCEMTEREQEIRERYFERIHTKYAWSSSDLLDYGDAITVGGTNLNARVKVIVHKTGNDLEVDYLDVRWISVISADGTELLLDQDAFKTSHRRLYEDFIAQVELRAMQVASGVPEADWSEVDTTPF